MAASINLVYAAFYQHLTQLSTHFTLIKVLCVNEVFRTGRWLRSFRCGISPNGPIYLCFRFMSSALRHMPESPFADKVRPTDTIIRWIYYDGVEKLITISRQNISSYSMMKLHDKTLRITDQIKVLYRIQWTRFSAIKPDTFVVVMLCVLLCYNGQCCFKST